MHVQQEGIAMQGRPGYCGRFSAVILTIGETICEFLPAISCTKPFLRCTLKGKEEKQENASNTYI